MQRSAKETNQAGVSSTAKLNLTDPLGSKNRLLMGTRLVERLEGRASPLMYWQNSTRLVISANGPRVANVLTPSPSPRRRRVPRRRQRLLRPQRSEPKPTPLPTDNPRRSRGPTRRGV